MESEANSMYYAISIVIISLFRPRLSFDVYFLLSLLLREHKFIQSLFMNSMVTYAILYTVSSIFSVDEYVNQRRWGRFDVVGKIRQG